MNKKPLLIITLLIIIAIFGIITYYQLVPTPVNTPVVVQTADPKNGTYLIDNASYILTNGKNETPVTGSTSKIVTRYFGNEVIADMNGDGVKDSAFLITQETGGTGTFYYAVALLSIQGGFVSSNVIFLGDRIAPQTTEYLNGQIVVNYTVRGADEPMTVNPSFGVSKKIDVVGDQLKEVVVGMTEAQARAIAEKSCVKGGVATNSGTYNANTKTWWFDANLNSTRPGCNPACVVSETTKSAEINWRCTGLVPPVSYKLDKSFVDEKQGIKYSYTETLPTIYYRLQDWSQTAKLTLVTSEYTCTLGDKTSVQVEKMFLNNTEYCVTTQVEGAAGSTYTTYTYTTPLLGKVATLTFVIGHPTTCMVYEGTGKQEACEKEVFSSNIFAEQILSSVQINK